MDTDTPNERRQSNRAKRGQNDGSVDNFPRSDGRWRARLFLPDGRVKSFYGKTRQEVKLKLEAAHRELAAGRVPPKEQQSVASFLNQWLAEVVQPTKKARTWEQYEWAVRVHLIPAFGRVKLARLTTQHVQSLIATKAMAKLSPRSIEAIHTTLTVALGVALKWGLVSSNVAKLAEPPKVTPPPRSAITLAEGQAIVAAMKDTPLLPLVQMALFTGLREGELLGLRWRDLDLDRGVFQVCQTAKRVKIVNPAEGEPKSKIVLEADAKTAGSRRFLPLAPQLVTILRAHRAEQERRAATIGERWRDHDLVFPTPLGTPQDGRNISHRFKDRIEAANLPPITFHGLRHAFVGYCLQQGVDAKTIQVLLGHANISTTLDIYGHLLPNAGHAEVTAVAGLFDPSKPKPAEGDSSAVRVNVRVRQQKRRSRQ